MAPIGTLESTLPGLLAALSDTGQAVLADHMGFCLAIAGYPSDTGEALPPSVRTSCPLPNARPRPCHAWENTSWMAGATWMRRASAA
jgi:hypothetical protein